MRKHLICALLCAVLLSTAAAAEWESPFGSHLSFNEKLLEMGRGCGVDWTRCHDYWIPFYWTPTEPEPGKFVWADEQVDTVRGYGYHILGVLGMPPGWAAVKVPPEERPEGHIAQWQTQKIDEWENYVYETVAHYRGRVNHFEVYNEPNIGQFFAPKPDPALYFVLLQRAYKAAKRADPDCVIAAPNPVTIEPGFLDVLLRLGLPQVCDVISVHAYNARPGRDLVKQLDTLKTLLRRYGCEKPIWITEVGWGMDPEDPDHSENVKANNHIHLNLIAWSNGIQRSFAYPFCGGTGGFVRDGETVEPVPLWFAYRTMTQVLHGAHPVGILSETPLLWGYLFEREGEAVAALWSEEPTRVEVPVGVPDLSLVERDGEKRTVRAPDRWLSVDLGPNPVYLVGVRSAQMGALAGCRVKPQHQRTSVGTSFEVTVSVRNDGDESEAIEVQPVEPDVWEMEPRLVGARIAPGEERAFAFRLTAPDPATLAEAPETTLYVDFRETTLTARRAAVDFDIRRDGARMARVRTTVDVAPDYGVIGEWLMLGPYDNSDRKALDRICGPEQATHPAPSYMTAEGEQAWTPLRSDDLLGVVDLGEFYGRHDEVCAFALCYVHSPANQPAELRVGRNDQMAAYLGGKEVWRKAEGRMVIVDDDTIPITLPAGTTPLLLKVCNLGRAWGFTARLTGPDGAPLRGVRVTTSP
jgi:hypothetical protein